MQRMFRTRKVEVYGSIMAVVAKRIVYLLKYEKNVNKGYF